VLRFASFLNVFLLRESLPTFNVLTLLTGRQEEYPARRKKMSDEVLVWLSLWSNVQMIAYCPANGTATSLYATSLKSRLV